MRVFIAAVPTCVALALVIPATARAKDKAAATKASPLSLETSAGFVTGTVNGGNIAKADIRAGLAYDVTRRFTLRLGLGIGTLRVGYKGALDDGFKVDAAMWSYAGLSADVGASYRFYDNGWFRLDGFADFETSLLRSDPVVTLLYATTPQGTFDITPYASGNTGAGVFWNRFAVGTQSRLFFGRFEPNLSIAFQRIESALDLRLNYDSRKTLTQLGYDPLNVEGRHDLSFWSVPLAPGLDVRFGKRSWLGVNITITPAGDNWLFGGGLLFRHAL